MSGRSFASTSRRRPGGPFQDATLENLDFPKLPGVVGARVEPHRVGESAHPKARGYARATQLPERPVGRTKIRRPLNIVPPAARTDKGSRRGARPGRA